MGFPKQEYWSGLSSPTLGDLPDSGIKTTSLVSSALAGAFFTTELPGKPILNVTSPFSKLHVTTGSWMLGKPTRFPFKTEGSVFQAAGNAVSHQLQLSTLSKNGPLMKSYLTQGIAPFPTLIQWLPGR